MAVYVSLLDVPLDEQDPADDGDDRFVPGEPIAHPQGLIRLSEPKGVADHTALAVPYFPLHGGLNPSRGKPVRALNRALSHAGFRRWQAFSLVYTVWVTRSVKRFQKSRGLPQTGNYDALTHERLARFYDQYAIRYLLVVPTPKPTQDELERAGFLAQLMYLYNHRMAIAYSQMRPSDCRRLPTHLDCSFYGENAAWNGVPGIGSLSGYPGCGYGNTDTQISRFRRLGRVRDSIATAKVCDPKFFGVGGDPSHEAYYLGVDASGVHRVISFGSYPIKVLAHDYRHDGICFCNLTGR